VFHFGCIFAIVVLAFPVGTFVIWPRWKKTTLSGIVTILATTTTLFYVIVHPFIFQALQGSEGTLSRWTHYTFWFVIVPTLTGSLFEPLPATEFASPWRLFCYVHVATASAQILMLQHLWGHHENAFIESIQITLERLPWFLSIFSAASAWGIRRVLFHRRRTTLTAS